MGEPARKLNSNPPPPRGRGRGGLRVVSPSERSPTPSAPPEPPKSAVDRAQERWGSRPTIVQGGDTINQGDPGNVAQKITDEKLGFNPAAKEIEDQEKNGTPAENSDRDVPEQEQAPPPPYKNNTSKTPQKSKVKPKGVRGMIARAKKAGPIGVSGGILSGSLITTIIMAPITVLINLSTLFFNHNDIGSHLFTKTGQSYIGSILKGQGRNCATSKIKCKFTTISDAQLKEWEERKIKVISEKTIFGRNKVRGLIMPNERVISTLRDWKNLKYIDRTSYNLLKRWSVRSYLADHGPFQRMFKKFKVSKSSTVKPDKSKDPEERRQKTNAAMDAHTEAKTGATVEERAKALRRAADADPKFKNRASAGVSKLRSATKAMDPATLATLMACAADTTVRSTAATVKLIWDQEKVKLAQPFAHAGSSMRDNGNIEPELVENLSDRLMKSTTKADAKDPEWQGKNAMDAPAMDAALRGDFEELKGHMNDYNDWAPVTAVRAQGVVREIEQAIPGGRTSIRIACKTAAIVAWAGLIGCVGPQVLGCVGKAVAQIAILNLVIEMTNAAEKIADFAAEPALDAVAEANFTSNLYGLPLGQALGGAFATMAVWKDRASGFPIAGSEQEVMAFYDSIEKEMQEEQLADAKFEAKQNQFNPYNQYSFFGRIASIVNPYIPQDDTLYSKFANIFATSFSVFGVPSYNAYAAKDGIVQPIGIYNRERSIKGTMKNCKDPYKNELNLPCLGEGGKTVTYLDPMILQCLEEEETSDRICVEDAIDYLEGRGMLEQGGSGKPVGWDKYEPGNPDKDYDNPLLRFWQNCTGDRTYDIGYSTKSYDAPNMDWHLGARCGNRDDLGNTITDPIARKDLAWMSYFAHECIGIYATEENAPLCWEENAVAAPATAPKPCKEGWTHPAPGTTYTSRFGPRWGTQHQGIDLAGPIGTPIVAACDGEVIDAGPASGFGLWVVIRHDIDGKKVDTVYGHNDSNLVSKGQFVTAGTPIATVGNRGDSQGPHLHFEMWEGGHRGFGGGTAIDPAPSLGLGEPTG